MWFAVLCCRLPTRSRQLTRADVTASRGWGEFLAGSVPQFPQLRGVVTCGAYSLEFSEGQTRMVPAGLLQGVLRGSDSTGRRGQDRDPHLLSPECTLALGRLRPPAARVCVGPGPAPERPGLGGRPGPIWPET